MADIEEEIDKLLEAIQELHVFVSRYTNIPQMNWTHSMHFLYVKECDLPNIYFKVERLEVKDYYRYDELFDAISEYNKIYFEMREYTGNGRLQPWDFRQLEILDGGDDWEEEEQYRNSVKYLYKLKEMKLFPEKYVYSEG